MLAAGLGVPLLAACSQGGEDSPGGSSDSQTALASSGGGTSGTATADPDTPSGWGPTSGELAAATELVASWNEERLAGQVLVGRYHGADPTAAAAMVKQLHLAGLCMTTSNIASAAQVRATTTAVRAAVAEDDRDFPAVLGVDQEGGVVSHLKGIATTFPPFSAAGRAVQAGRPEVVREASAAMGAETASYGYTWIFAPVADVTIGSADPIIGSRSPSKDAAVAATATAEAVKGFNASGIVSTTKHFPGHGGVTTDSHKGLPVQAASVAALQAKDLKPFAAAIAAGAPSIMLSHINVTSIAPGGPASCMPKMYEFLRGEMGFQGVAITDSLGMGAVMGKGDPGVRALAAGADLILMPVNTAVTHRRILAAVSAGTITPERLREAAARVVALQRWQARAVKTTSADAAQARARRAAEALRVV